MNRTNAGAFKAIEDMKELVAGVEGADPLYEELRNNARSAGMGCFEYAVKDYGVRGLTELFKVLSEQKKKAEEEAKMRERMSDAASIVRAQQQASASVFGFGKRSKYE